MDIQTYLLQQLAIAGQGMWQSVAVITIHGGWLLFFVFFAHLTFGLYVDRMQGIFASSIEFVLLAISIPKMNEQTPRAVENFFNQLSGAHGTQDLVEKYWLGQFQLWFSFEIISIEGYLQFVIYSPKKFRDLVESGIYAQYPDAEITEIEDYTKFAPHHFPDKEYDLWGTEFTLVKGSEFPIATYRDFEHPVTKEFFKDPMAAMLEAMSRIGKGEQFWFQIYIAPTGKEWQKKHFEAAAKLTVDLSKKRATPERPFPILHRAETQLVEDVYRKATKIGFNCKMRAVYIAKKDKYNLKRVQYGFIGAIKQFARDDANGIKPLYAQTGTSAHYLFKDWQKNERKHEILAAYRGRSGSRGGHKFILNVEELATLWHFPMAHAVRVPTLKQTEAKRSEAPSRLPLETMFEDEVSSLREAHAAPPSGEKGGAKHHSHDAPPPSNLPFA